MKKIILTAALLLCSETAVTAETRFALSPSLLHFDYTEFSTTNTVLNREQGWIPGIKLGITQSFATDWRIGLTGSYYQGSVDYDGQTQSGTPHLTQTDTTLLRLGARIEKTIFNNTNLFITTVSHQWRRDIRSNNGVSGILETYRWIELAIGLNYNFILDAKNTLNLEAAYLITRSATIDVDLTRVDLGTAVLDIGDGSGGKVDLNWSYRYTDTTSLGLSLFFEAWDFGRSNTKPTQGGSSSVFITEPRSETRNTGIYFNIEYNF
jgi:hypothetical protein